MLAEKELLLNEIKNRIDPKVGFILTAYQNLTANKMSEFRSQLYKSKGDFFALKKRVLLKAAKDLQLSLEQKELQGHVGIVFVNDNLVTTTKALSNFKKENEGTIAILGGYFEGKKCTPSDIEAIAQLPTQAEMRAQFLSVLEAPLSHMLSVFEAIMTSVIYCLDNKSQQQ